jgi:hypothetical protein
MSPRDRILAALDALGADEAEVLALVAERLVAGRAVYGPLQLATDRRDFQHEALLELADGVAYLAMGIVRASHGRPGANGAGPSAPEGPMRGGCST